jgi:hypothetical protein
VALKLGELWEYRELFYFLVWRDVKVRYKQTVLGVLWAILQPFFTMVVFSIFFGRLAHMPSDGVPYPIFAYAALVLGDFYDPDTIPDLLAALDNPPLPAFLDGMEADCAADGECPTQYNSVFDALRKIGAPSAAQRVRSMWMGSGTPAGPAPKKPPGRGAPAAPAAPSGPDLQTKVLAIGAYAFVSRDQVGVDELGKIAADNGAEDLLRKAAAESFARLARDADDIKVLDILADKYKNASIEKKKASEGKPKEEADKADKEFAAEKKKNDDAKAKVLAYTRDPNRKADEIKAVAKEAKDAEEKKALSDQYANLLGLAQAKLVEVEKLYFAELKKDLAARDFAEAGRRLKHLEAVIGEAHSMFKPPKP